MWQLITDQNGVGVWPMHPLGCGLNQGQGEGLSMLHCTDYCLCMSVHNIHSRPFHHMRLYSSVMSNITCKSFKRGRQKSEPIPQTYDTNEKYKIMSMCFRYRPIQMSKPWPQTS